jgi:hypothetical protein
MPSSYFRADLPCPLVGDASVWINLIATTRVDEILAAVGLPFAVTDVVLGEVRRGRVTGRTTAPALDRLVETGVVVTINLIDSDEVAFFELIAGRGTDTLDDGEAATIVCAGRVEGTALIDERKAARLATSRWSSLPLVSTPDLLHCDAVRRHLGPAALSEAFYRALTGANMHIPERLMASTLELLTPYQVTECLSLPARVRRTAEDQSAPFRTRW